MQNSFEEHYRGVGLHWLVESHRFKTNMQKEIKKTGQWSSSSHNPKSQGESRQMVYTTRGPCSWCVMFFSVFLIHTFGVSSGSFMRP